MTIAKSIARSIAQSIASPITGASADPYGTDLAMEFNIASPAETLTIPCQNVGTFNATIDWGDDSTSEITAYNDADLAHTYTDAGTYVVRVSGTFPNIFFNNGGDRNKLLRILNWGSVGFETLQEGFEGCDSLTSVTSYNGSAPALASVQKIFNNCNVVTDIDMSDIISSSIVNFVSVCESSPLITTLNISGDKSGATSFASMVFNCASLTEIVGHENMVTATTTNIGSALRSCPNLTGVQIDQWDVTNINNATMMMNSSNNALSTADYDAALIAYDGLASMVSGEAWDFGDATYSAGAAATARASLISKYSLIITDGGPA